MANTCPGFALRGLDWDQITQRHAHLPELHGEEFLLGLQGLEHVTVLAEPTGGGSGRPRTITITPELTISIGTALTYDRQHRCIELNGLPVDGPATTFAR